MTSYSPPHRFAHADIPTAAQLQTYCTALDAIHERMGDKLLIYSSANLLPGEDNNHFFVHRYRYLWYRGDGTLEDPAPGGATISLSDGDEPTRLDLASIGWLAPGKLYYVSDCVWCQETERG